MGLCGHRGWMVLPFWLIRGMQLEGQFIHSEFEGGRTLRSRYWEVVGRVVLEFTEVSKLTGAKEFGGFKLNKWV